MRSAVTDADTNELSTTFYFDNVFADILSK